jgi:hypothetical protein
MNGKLKAIALAFLAFFGGHEITIREETCPTCGRVVAECVCPVYDPHE